MADLFDLDKQITAIGALVESFGVRSIEHVSGVNRETIMRLGMIQECGDATT